MTRDEAKLKLENCMKRIESLDGSSVESAAEIIQSINYCKVLESYINTSDEEYEKEKEILSQEYKDIKKMLADIVSFAEGSTTEIRIKPTDDALNILNSMMDFCTNAKKFVLNTKDNTLLLVA